MPNTKFIYFLFLLYCLNHNDETSFIHSRENLKLAMKVVTIFYKVFQNCTHVDNHSLRHDDLMT